MSSSTSETSNPLAGNTGNEPSSFGRAGVQRLAQQAETICRLPAPSEEWTAAGLAEESDLTVEEAKRFTDSIEAFENDRVVEKVTDEDGKPVKDHGSVVKWTVRAEAYELATWYAESRNSLPCGHRVALGNRGDEFECLTDGCTETYEPAAARQILEDYRSN